MNAEQRRDGDPARLPQDRSVVADLCGGLEHTLTWAADHVVAAVPGAEGAGLTVIEGGRPQTVVTTDFVVREIDDIQYRLNEGPCISAVAEERTFASGNLGGEARWPRFGPRVGRLGAHSALGVPLRIKDEVVGALNIYAHHHDAFDERAVRIAETLAPYVATSVANAQSLEQAQRHAAQLHQALTSRAEIDQAIGIIMSRSGVSAEEAFARLRAMSQSRSVKLADVARDLLSEAVRRVRARNARTRTRTDQD